MKPSKFTLNFFATSNKHVDLYFITNVRKWPYSPSFLIDLESIDPRIKNVIDMVFLADYYEPTLAILFQSEQTWTG